MSDAKPTLAYPSLPSRTSGAPKPARFKPVWPLVTGLLGTAAVAGGSFFSLVGYSRNSCRGATRSTQLTWQQRQAEIREAVAQQRQNEQQESTRHAE